MSAAVERPSTLAHRNAAREQSATSQTERQTAVAPTLLTQPIRCAVGSIELCTTLVSPDQSIRRNIIFLTKHDLIQNFVLFLTRLTLTMTNPT